MKKIFFFTILIILLFSSLVAANPIPEYTGKLQSKTWEITMNDKDTFFVYLAYSMQWSMSGMENSLTQGVLGAFKGPEKGSYKLILTDGILFRTTSEKEAKEIFFDLKDQAKTNGWAVSKMIQFPEWEKN